MSRLRAFSTLDRRRHPFAAGLSRLSVSLVTVTVFRSRTVVRSRPAAGCRLRLGQRKEIMRLPDFGRDTAVVSGYLAAGYEAYLRLFMPLESA